MEDIRGGMPVLVTTRGDKAILRLGQRTLRGQVLARSADGRACVYWRSGNERCVSWFRIPGQGRTRDGDRERGEGPLAA